MARVCPGLVPTDLEHFTLEQVNQLVTDGKALKILK